ncbi:MAG: zf-TFIIB domain-containing protein, partial [Deltaproteobacteria bacterium]|nr:zf-TFIIB domain-containing protein [Deltaproteobacteria bacterium]
MEGQARCPRCGTALEERSSGAVTAWPCLRCAGVWLDHGTGRVLLTEGTGTNAAEMSDQLAAAAQVDVDRDQAGLKCPMCAAPMSRIKLKGVTVDICLRHGTWFDKDELKDLALACRKEYEATAPAGEATVFSPPPVDEIATADTVRPPPPRPAQAAPPPGAPPPGLPPGPPA